MAAILLIVAGITLVSVWIIGFYLDRISTDMKTVKILLSTLVAGPPKGGGSHERAE